MNIEKPIEKPEMTFKDLLIEHSYYCSDTNYYSNDAGSKFNSWAEFFEEFCDADIDMNLIFRWDIRQRDNSEKHGINSYYMKVFMMHQRKGIFAPIYIDNVYEVDLPSIKILLGKHHEYLKELWKPF